MNVRFVQTFSVLRLVLLTMVLNVKISNFSSIRSFVCIFISQLLKSDLNIRWSVCFLSSFTHKLFLKFSIFFVFLPVKIFSLFLSPDLSFCISDSQFLESKLELSVAKLCHRVEVISY